MGFYLRSNPFFVQSRPGKDGKIFKMIKLKTMRDISNSDQTDDRQRLTKAGIILRKFSIDELPELINVLNGDMSLIGPRPLLTKYLERYNPYQLQRHDVRPGITGLAQIKGRNSLKWNQKFRYDIFYVKKLSFKLDVYILTKTIANLIFPTNINSKNHATMEEFHG